MSGVMLETPLQLQEQITQVMQRLSEIKKEKLTIGAAIHDMLLSKAHRNDKNHYNNLTETARCLNVEAKELHETLSRLRNEKEEASRQQSCFPNEKEKDSKQQRRRERAGAHTLQDRKDVARFIIQAANDQIDLKQLGIAIDVLQEISVKPFVARCADLQKEVDDLRKRNQQLQQSHGQQPMPVASPSLRLLRRLWDERFRVSEPVRRAQGYTTAMYLSLDDEAEVRRIIGE
jgi:FtsZ-binding cell division protein ZapB